MGKTLLLMNVRWPTDRYYIKKICEENNQNIEAQATYKFSKYGLRYISCYTDAKNEVTISMDMV